MNKRLMACGLLAALLTTALFGCGKTDGSGDADQTPVLTVIRTKTPQLPFNEDSYTNLQQGGALQEKGDGLELDGYEQLLDSIDRKHFSAPAGWDRHPVDDLFDGIFETTDQGTNKYGTGGGPFTIEFQLEESKVLSAYVVVTASDAESYPDRNPQNWTIEASEDGEHWVTLDTVRGADLPTQNYTPVTYKIGNADSYRYYRWNIEETVGNEMFQASELLLYTKK